MTELALLATRTQQSVTFLKPAALNHNLSVVMLFSSIVHVALFNLQVLFMPSELLLEHVR